MEQVGIDAIDTSSLPEGMPLSVALSMTGQAHRSVDEILRIVLRGVCGFESVEDLCRREGITAEQFRAWRQLFSRVCQQWTQDNQHLIAEAVALDRDDEDVADFVQMRPVRSDA